MQEKHKLIVFFVIIMVIGLSLGILFGYITGLASSALGIVNFEDEK